MSDEQSEFVMRYEGRGAPGPKGDPGEQGKGISRGARRAAVFLFAFSVVLAVLNFSWTVHQVNTSQQDWCQTLDLLTARPVPRPADPAANPSREQGYMFYTDFRDLRRSLGCD